MINLSSLLEQKLLRPTKKRMLMLQFFYDLKAYANAKTLKQWLFDQHELDVSNDTIYKNLQLFVEKGLLQDFVVDLERQYFYSGNHKHYAICTSCHCVSPLDMQCPATVLGDRYGQIQSHRFEMFVICPKCQ